MKIWHMKTWKDFAEIPHQAYVLLLFCLFVLTFAMTKTRAP